MLLIGVSLSGCVQNSHDVQHDKHAVVSKHIELATQYFSYNRTSDAITRLYKALAIDPKSAEAKGLLGFIYQHQEEYVAAEKFFLDALRLKPQDSGIRNNYAILLYVQKRYQEAVRQFIKVSLDLRYPNRDQAFENLGATYLEVGDTKHAKEAYQSAVRLNSSAPLAHLKLSDIFFEEKEMELAYEHYQVFEIQGQQTASSLWLGIRLASYFKKGHQLESYMKRLAKEFGESSEYLLCTKLINNKD